MPSDETCDLSDSSIQSLDKHPTNKKITSQKKTRSADKENSSTGRKRNAKNRRGICTDSNENSDLDKRARRDKTDAKIAKNDSASSENEECIDEENEYDESAPTELESANTLGSKLDSENTSSGKSEAENPESQISDSRNSESKASKTPKPDIKHSRQKARVTIKTATPPDTTTKTSILSLAYRPFSALEIHIHFKNTVKKKDLATHLTSLVTDNRILEKKWNRSILYAYNYALNITTDTEYTSKKSELQKVKQAVSRLRQKIENLLQHPPDQDLDLLSKDSSSTSTTPLWKERKSAPPTSSPRNLSLCRTDSSPSAG